MLRPKRVKVENDRRATKRRPILMAPLHPARQDSRDPSSSFPFQICRGQIRNRGLLRTPEPPSISLGSREPPEGQRKNKQRGREEASGSGRRLRPPGTHQSRAIQVEVHIVRCGPTTQNGATAIREGFSKVVQEILDQDRQTGQNQLLIEEMVQLKIQYQAGPVEVQNQASPIQFRSLVHNRPNHFNQRSRFNLHSNPVRSS
ncbi:hypothetical protein DY000_02021427 [Brassica cretica]|uniref:Uncharacterized protein n=1 Tax=Brassica cretica TaxID=69181 RepID=A0ABQ7E0T6_BRACR|nr:hypothetical protein DY000_02021427 [Brassica cretica]